MMAQPNRPRRSRKEVSYTSFDGNDDSDEDFATSTPPVSKKTKKEKPDAGNKKRKDKPKAKEPKRKAPAERKAVDDRIFDKELELALEISRVESASQDPPDGNQTEERLKGVTAEPLAPSEKVIADIHIPGEVKEAALIIPDGDISEVPESARINSRLKAPDSEDEITFIETVEVGSEEKQKNGRTRRRAATTAANKQRQLLEESDEDEESVAGGDDDDGDFKADEEDVDSSDGGNDDDDAGDKDFSFSPKKKRRKGSGGGTAKTVAKPKKTAAGRQTKSPKQANENKVPKSAAVRKTPSRTKGQGNSFKPPLTANNSISKSPNMPPVRQIKRKPVVVSPKDSNSSNPLGGVRLVSPGQPFRLGLSRFARVKPLHGNISAS